MNKNLIVIATLLLLVSCSKVDDYMLGKDNTPKAAPLKPVAKKVDVIPQWTTQAGTKINQHAYLKMQPVIHSDIVYTSDSGGSIEAINKKNGEIQWRQNLNAEIVGGPAVHDEQLAITSADAKLYVLSKTDGSTLWKKNLSSEVLAKPVFSHDKIIVKTIHGALYAFNRKNGEQLWYYEHGTPGLILKASSAPVIAGPLVLAGFSDGKLEGINLETGISAWSRNIAYGSGASDVERLVDIDADPIVRGNVAYIATYQGYIGALSLDDGHIIWNRPASIFKNMTLNGNALYYTDSDDVVWSINAINGKVNWKQDALKARGLTEPTVIANQLALADKAGVLHFLNKSTGEITGREQIPSGVSIAPASQKDHLFVLNNQGRLYDFKVSNLT